VVFGVTDRRTRDRLSPRLHRMVDLSPIVLLGWVMPRLECFGPWKRFRDNQIQVDELLYAEIAERRRALDLAERTDVLSRLLHVGANADDVSLTDAELRDQLVTLLLARPRDDRRGAVVDALRTRPPPRPPASRLCRRGERR